MKTAIKQALTSRGFFIGAAGVLIIMALSSITQITSAVRGLEYQELMHGFSGELVLSALSSDAFTLVLPIAAALPYTASFIDDAKSGFLKEYLPRTTIKSYISSKLIAAMLSGGLVLFIGLLISYGISFLCFSSLEGALAEGMTEEPYFAMLISRAFLLFFSGALWSAVGLCLSSATGSKYMAFAAPFIIYYVLIILNERYFPSVFVLYPKEWINPSPAWPLGWLGVILLLCELTAAASAGFWLAAKRRIESI